MLNITNSAAWARALDSPIDLALKGLLRLRGDQLMTDTGGEYDLGDLVQFVVVGPGDTITRIEAAAGYPVVTSPAFEWVAEHDGWYEAVTILSDDGFGIVLLVPDIEGVNPALLALLRSHVTPAPTLEQKVGHEDGSTTA